MKKKPLHRISSLLAATVLGLFLLTALLPPVASRPFGGRS